MVSTIAVLRKPGTGWFSSGFCDTVPSIRSTNIHYKIYSSVCEICCSAWRIFSSSPMFDIFKTQQAALKIQSFLVRKRSFCATTWGVFKDIELSRHFRTYTKLHFSFQNTPNNLHNFVCSVWGSLCDYQQYHNANTSDVYSFPIRSDGPK